MWLRQTLLLLIILLLTCSPVLATTFKIATIAPEGSFWMVEMRQAAEIVQQRTGGRVNFRFYPGGVMGTEKSVLRKIRIGQLHGGMFTSGGLEDISPDLRIYSLPLLFNDLDEVDHVRARFDDTLRQRLAAEGFVSFGFAEGGFAMFMGNKPLHGVADIRGQKVWVPEGDQVYYRSMEALGLSPVPLPITDVLTGLQTGLVDIVATSPIGALVFQWQTRVTHLATTPLTYLLGVFAIDKRSFDRLSPPDRQVVQEVIEPLFKTFDKQNRRDNEEAWNTMVTQGITPVAQSPAEIAELRALNRSAIEEMSRDGLFDRELWQQIDQHLRAFRKQNGA